MMISQSAEYALRAVVWLAGYHDGNLGTGRIAESVKVPPGYLAKVMQKLARAGLVVSEPGRSGGFCLARPAASISVLEVVDAVDPIRLLEGCPLHLPSHEGRLCPLHRRLDDAARSVRDAFARSTIADLLNEETLSPPLRELLDDGTAAGTTTV